MASKRILKKEINFLGSELINECFAYQQFHTDAPAEKIEEIANKILQKRNELVARLNLPTSEMTRADIKAYFKKINEEFIDSIKYLDELAALK
ncbi:MAG TPA: hypothetical protein DCM02_06775 [Flavobacterium sp.]|nr:hypothetical protein [Flavobacterium sp.]